MPAGRERSISRWRPTRFCSRGRPGRAWPGRGATRPARWPSGSTRGRRQACRDQPAPMPGRPNAMPNYVLSATLGSADEWDHTTIVGYDDIAGLREREQLLTYGCGRLARDLLADGLLDVLVLSLTPVVAGAGRRLFDDPGHLVRLRLTDSTTFETGSVRLFLKPDQA